MQMPEQAVKYGRLLDHLLQSGLVTEAHVRSAQVHKTDEQSDLVEVMLEHGLISEIDLARGIASFFRFPLVNLTRIRVTKRALQAATGEFCRRHQVLPFGVDPNGGELLVAVSDPSQVSVTDALRFRNNQKIKAYVAPRTQLREAIEFYYFGEGAASLRKRRRSGAAGATGLQPPTNSYTAIVPDQSPPVLTAGDDSVIPRRRPQMSTGGTPVVQPGPAQISGAFENVNQTAPRQLTTGPLADTLPAEADPDAPAATEAAPSATAAATADATVEALEARVLQLETALRAEMKVSKALAEILVENGLISSEQLKRRLRG